MFQNDSIESTLAMKKLQEELASSPEKARAFLVRAGIVTPDGELTEPYRREPYRKHA